MKSLFLYTWAGTFVDLIVPCQAVCGEVTRIYLVRKDNRENYGAIAASSITNRIISYVISSIGLLIGIVLLLSRATTDPFLLNLLIIALIGTAIYLVILFYLAFKEKAPKNLATIVFKLLKSLNTKRFSPEALSMKVEDALTVFHQGFVTFRKNPKHIVKPMVYQLISLILNIAVYMLVFYSIGYVKDLDLGFFILAYFIVGTVQIAAAVFSVGTLEIILTSLFHLYGVPLDLSVIAATLLRFLTFWLPVFVGYVTVQVIGARSLLNPKAREGLAAQQSIEETSAEPQKKPSEAGL